MGRCQTQEQKVEKLIELNTLKYKISMQVQRSVILLLMMVVFVGCGEDDLGGIAKVTGTLLAIGSQISSDGVLVVASDDSSNIEKGIITVTVHERGSLANGPSLPLVNNQAAINYSGLALGAVTDFVISWRNYGQYYQYF